MSSGILNEMRQILKIAYNCKDATNCSSKIGDNPAEIAKPLSKAYP
jgi:hypothetical protein